MKKEEFMKEFNSKDKQKELILSEMMDMIHNPKVFDEVKFKNLIKMIDDVNFIPKDQRLYSALHLAARRNRPDYAKLLIEAGADVNLKTGQSMLTPLKMVQFYPKGVVDTTVFEMVDLLLDSGAEIEESIKNTIEKLYIAKQIDDKMEHETKEK